MNEKVLEKKLVSEVEKLGGLALKLWAVSVTGLPDRLVLLPIGRVCFVELKTTGKVRSPRQNIVSKTLQKLGFSVYLVDSEISLSAVINKVK